MENKSPRTPEELIRMIGWYKQWLLNELNCYIAYDTWEPSKEALVKSRNYVIEAVFKNELISKEEIDQLSKEQLLIIGFNLWETEDNESLLLMPLVLVPVFKEDILVIGIDDEEELLKDTDKDIRYGCIPSGFKRKEGVE
nr:MAG TPA: hypothetical protein [Caudoviricetes sp.]